MSENQAFDDSGMTLLIAEGTGRVAQTTPPPPGFFEKDFNLACEVTEAMLEDDALFAEAARLLRMGARHALMKHAYIDGRIELRFKGSRRR